MKGHCSSVLYVLSYVSTLYSLCTRLPYHPILPPFPRSVKGSKMSLIKRLKTDLLLKI